MAKRPLSVCRHPGCNTLIAISGFCEKHQKENGWWRKKENSGKRGYGHKWRQIRERIFQRDKGLCQECLRHGVYVPGTDVDHIIPKSQGGTDDPSNLQLLCPACHKQKTKREALYGKNVEKTF